MSERPAPRGAAAGGRRRWRPGWRLVGPALLLAALGGASLVDPLPGIRLAAADRTRVTEMRALIGRLPDGARVVVGFDPDIGTYPEIRPAVRSTLRLLATVEPRLTIISVTTEGRALAAAELDALGSEVEGALLAPPRWLSGAEAGLVSFADEIGAARPALAIVIGGIDVSPRSWVEQVGPRLPGLPLAALAPSALRPELEPYRASGQLAALVAALPDLAALARAGESSAAGAGGRAVADRGPGGLAVLVGMLLAIVALVRAAAGPWLVLPRRGRTARR